MIQNHARFLFLTVVVSSIVGCGSDAVKVAGGLDTPPTTPRAKKAAEAAEAEQKIPRKRNFD